MSDRDTGGRSKCAHCGKRIFERIGGRYGQKHWQHANGDLHCTGLSLSCKYATPSEVSK